MARQMASKMHNRITIEQPIEQQDDFGQLVKSWQKLATVWADVKFSSGSEYQRNQVDYGDVVASVRIRMRRDVNNGMRIIVHDFNDLLMAIESVQPNVQHRACLDLVCRGGRNEGD